MRIQDLIENFIQNYHMGMGMERPADAPVMENDDDIVYFSYGHLTDADHMQDLIPGAEYMGVATLPDYRLRLHEFADIEHSPGDQIVGVLWRISVQDEHILDHHERAGINYQAEHHEVMTEQGSEMARLYHMIKQLKLAGRPTDHYVQRIARGYKQHGVPLAQLQDAVDRIARPY